MKVGKVKVDYGRLGKVKAGDLVKCCEYYGGMIGVVTKITPSKYPRFFMSIIVQGEWEVDCYDIEVEVINESR